MKKFQSVTAVIGLVILVLLGVSGLFLSQVQASDSTASKISVENTASIPQINDRQLTFSTTNNQQQAVPVPQVNSALSNTDSDTTSQASEEGEAVLSTIKSLNAKRLAAVLGDTGGWLLLRAERYILGASNAPLPNNVELPDTQISETWFNVGADGEYSQLFSRMLTTDGSVIQESYLKEGVEHNTTLNTATTSSSQKRTLTSLDWGSYWILKSIATTGAEITGTVQEDSNGAVHYVVTAVERYQSSVQFASYSERVVTTERRAVYDWENGAFLYGETVFVTVSGERVINESITPLNIEIVDERNLPVEVLRTLGN